MTEKDIEAMETPSTWAIWTLARIESEVRMEPKKEPNYTLEALKLALIPIVPLVLAAMVAALR